jgi:hypothetical protein
MTEKNIEMPDPKESANQGSDKVVGEYAQPRPLNNPEGLQKKGSSGPRRSGQSKREMMEELNRARFPWEE